LLHKGLDENYVSQRALVGGWAILSRMTDTDPKTPPHPTSDIWRAARSDYLSGHSAAVVAERYGLSSRTIQRRAAAEGWRHADVRPATRIRSNWAGPAAAVMRAMDSLDTAHAACPELAEVSALADEQRHDLLFSPDATRFRLFAFRQATEAAALGGINEATAWMRLLALIDRQSSQIDGDVHTYGQVDRLRANYLAQIDALRAEDEDAPPGAPCGA